jgi:hypothetical protein
MEAIEELAQLSESMRQASALLADETSTTHPQPDALPPSSTSSLSAMS